MFLFGRGLVGRRIFALEGPEEDGREGSFRPEGVAAGRQTRAQLRRGLSSDEAVNRTLPHRQLAQTAPRRRAERAEGRWGRQERARRGTKPRAWDPPCYGEYIAHLQRVGRLTVAVMRFGGRDESEVLDVGRGGRAEDAVAGRWLFRVETPTDTGQREMHTDRRTRGIQ